MRERTLNLRYYTVNVNIYIKKTRMTTFIKIISWSTNIDKYRVAANITKYLTVKVIIPESLKSIG